MALKENYKDDILDVSQNVKRKYQMETNGDGTVSFTDVTEYTQQGDSFGASDMNATNGKVNTLDSTVSTLNANLDGFKFYPIGTSIVGLISDDSAYTDEDGNYVVWGTATAEQLVEASPNTYYGRQSEEDCRGEAGADTAIPFNKENPYQFNIYRMQTSAGTYDQVQQINEPQLSVIKTGSVENDVFKYVYSSHTITAKTSLKLHYKTFGVNDQTYPIRLADMTTRTLNANETFTIPFGGYNGAASFAVVEV